MVDIVIVSCGIILAIYLTGMMIHCIKNRNEEYEGQQYLEPDLVK